jgi:hypothetical protein
VIKEKKVLIWEMLQKNGIKRKMPLRKKMERNVRNVYLKRTLYLTVYF